MMLCNKYLEDVVSRGISKDDDEKKVDIYDEIPAVDGRKYSAEKVFVAMFKHLKKESGNYLSQLNVRAKPRQIQWIITVPAIWSDSAKSKMQNWMIEAGLVERDEKKRPKDQCKIVYEPDCASLAIQHKIKGHKIVTSPNNITDDYESEDDDKDEEKQNTYNFTNKGQTYILVDAGGGTVDIACHELMDECDDSGIRHVQEVHHPSGGPWGSCYIDDEYIKILKEIFGKDTIERFEKLNPNKYIDLMHAFQEAKVTFYSDKNQDAKKHNVRLPNELLQFLDHELNPTNSKAEESDSSSDSDSEDSDDNVGVANKVKEAKINGKSGLTQLNGDILEMDIDVWRFMFDQVINKTVNHIKGILDNIQAMKSCEYLCLVGGLSCSKYFQHRMDEEFGSTSQYGLQSIIPEKPILAVVQGAAYFGITKNYIQGRILQRTYGCVVTVSEQMAEEAGVPEDHIAANEDFNQYKQGWYVSKCFVPLVRKNEKVLYGTVKQQIGTRKSPTTKGVKIRIYCSDKENPLTESDGIPLGDISLTWEDHEKDMEVVIEFNFSDTTIQVHTYKKSNPDVRKTTHIDYKK